MEIHWGTRCQIYVTPIGPEEIRVVVISRDSHLRLGQALPEFKKLFARLKTAPATTTERGAPSPSRRLDEVQRGRVLLVGDASGSVDAITGEGMRLGFEQGLALAGALAGTDLAAYAVAHRRLMRRPAFMAKLMLSMDRSAWLRQRAFASPLSDPRLFAGQLAMHMGAATTSDFIRFSCSP